MTDSQIKELEKLADEAAKDKKAKPRKKFVSRAKKKVPRPAKDKKVKQQKQVSKTSGNSYYKARKQSITPLELSKLVHETEKFVNYGRLNYVQAGIRAAKLLGFSQLFGEFVGAAFSRDYRRISHFTGKRGRRKQHQKRA